MVIEKYKNILTNSGYNYSKNGGTDSLKGTLCALFLRGVVDMDFKIGDKLEVEIIDLSNEGTGIGKCQGFTFL